MKPVSPHDPHSNELDDLIAAALHGDLSPAERVQFEARLNHDPAAQAAYQEALAMHDLLEKTNRSAQPDSDFEQRMVSGVRRKLNEEKHRETAWESLVVLWKAVTRRPKRFGWTWVVGVFAVLAILSGVLFSTGGSNEQAARRAKAMMALQPISAPYQGLSSKMALGNSTTTSNGVTFTAGSLAVTASQSANDSQRLQNNVDGTSNAIASAGSSVVTTSNIALPNSPVPSADASNSAFAPGAEAAEAAVPVAPSAPTPDLNAINAPMVAKALHDPTAPTVAADYSNEGSDSGIPPQIFNADKKT